MIAFYNKHYIVIDGQGRITDGWSRNWRWY